MAGWALKNSELSFPWHSHGCDSRAGEPALEQGSFGESCGLLVLLRSMAGVLRDAPRDVGLCVLCCCSQLTRCFVPVTHPSTELEYLSQQQISMATNSLALEIFMIFEVSFFL